MSQINLKSITGITSITTPAGVDNVFTVHTNDTTERFRVDSTGNLNIAGIITASQGLKINVSPAITIRDGTTEKGYIGFNGNDPFIGRKNGVGVAFQNNKIRPVDGDDGSGSTNTVDLGEPTYRFKDGYFAGSLDIEGDIDVNRHTNLDNVSIAGVTTFSNNVKFDGATAGRDVTFIRSSNTLEFATNAIIELGNSGSGDCRLFNNGSDTRIINGNGKLQFESDDFFVKDKDNTTTRLSINPTGISTFYNSQLHIEGAGSGNVPLTINTDVASNNSVHPLIQAYSDNATYKTQIGLVREGSSGALGWAFLTNSVGSPSEKLRITSGGSVGINTTVDAATKLQVQSDGTSTTAGGNVVARFQSNGSGRDATIQLSDNVANSATISMLSSAFVFKQSGTQTLQIAGNGKVTFGDGNNLAADYVATMLIDGGDHTKLTIYSATDGTGSVTFSDGSGSGATRRAGFIDFVHGANDITNSFGIGLADVNKVFIRNAGSNRGQLEVYGAFNESDTPAIEINHGNDARKVFLTNSSGDFNALTRNGSQTKGQLKMFESGILLHNMKDPDSTNTLQTFRAQTYRSQTGSTNPSISPDQIWIQKGGAGTYDCFREGNMELEVNGSSSNDHYQPVAFVPLGYDLDTTSFGGQWAGEMWIHQVSSQNPTTFGYSGYNTWATMSFKCRWDCAHWNAKPSGFWVEHYINQGRAQIGKIDASTTMSQFVIYLLPGQYKIRYNCLRGMSVHRSSSAGGSITLRDGGSFATYSTLAYSSRNTSFDSEIAPGSATFAHCT